MVNIYNADQINISDSLKIFKFVPKLLDIALF